MLLSLTSSFCLFSNFSTLNWLENDVKSQWNHEKLNAHWWWKNTKHDEWAKKSFFDIIRKSLGIFAFIFGALSVLSVEIKSKSSIYFFNFKKISSDNFSFSLFARWWNDEITSFSTRGRHRRLWRLEKNEREMQTFDEQLWRKIWVFYISRSKINFFLIL